MKKVLAALLCLAMITGIMPVISFAAEEGNVAKYFPLYGEYQFNDAVNEGEALKPPSDGNAVVGDEYLTLHRNEKAGNADNTGHVVSNMPGEKLTGEKVSFAFNAKVDLNQSREVSKEEEVKRTIFLYGSSDYSKNCITLRYYYAENTAAVVLVQDGKDAVVASFKRPIADMWHSYAIALDGAAGGKLTVYVDGEKVSEVDSKGITADKIGGDVLRLNRATSSNTINVDAYYRDLRFIKGVIDEKQADKYYNDIKDLVWKELVNQTYVTEGMITRTDINLPTGNGIKWESSDEVAVNPLTGKVTRPLYGEDAKDVTLTLVYDGKKQDYKVTLLPIDAGDLILTSFDFDSAEVGSKITIDGEAKYSAGMTGYGQAADIAGDFKMVVNKTDGSNLLAGLDSFTISYDSKTGANTNPFITVGDKIKIVDSGLTFAVGVDTVAVAGVGRADWKKVTVSVSETEIKAYIDGEVIASQTGNFDLKAMLNNAPVTIGAGGEGLVDNVMIFSRALTVDEINEYMAANIAPVMNVNGGSQDYLVDTFEPITITHPSGNAFIFYTLDGSEPTRESNRYEGAFHCDGDAHIKARAIATNGTKSEMVEAWVYNRPWAATAAEFRIDGENTINNVKVAWPLYPKATRYEVYRDGKLVGTTIGDAVDEYNLPVNVNVKYTVKAYNGNIQIAEGTTNTVTTFAIDVTETTGYDDNRKRGWVPTDENGDNALATPKPSGNLINGKYYKFKNEGVSRELFESLGFDPKIWDNKCTCVAFYYQESEDGFNWPTEWTPIYPVFIDLRFEGKQTGMHPDGETYIWSAHAEGTHGYDVAKLFFAAFKPGRDTEPVKPYAYTVSGNVILPQDEPWEQYENYGDKAGSNQLSSFYIGRPFGYDSRDMVRYTEGDTMYTFSSTRMNQDKLVIKLDENWTKPVEVTNVILKSQRREAPSVFKSGDRYYIYTSIANGWFASQAKYSSATEIDGVWSPGRPIANAGTFGSQANGVWGYGSEAGRWVQRGHGYNWGQSGGWRKTNYQIFFHMALNDGIATGNWCYKMEYHPYWGAIAVQSGETVSLGKKAYIDGKVCPNLTDNVQLERTGVTEVDHLPYQIIVDLEVPTVVSEVNLTNDIYNGSNASSYFKVYGSNDQASWEFLADATSKDDDDPAFRSCWVDTDKAFRYIKVDVLEVNNIQGGNNSALWAGKPLEVAIYGKPEGWKAEYYDLDAQEEILVGYGQNNIDFTPYGQTPVIVNDRTLVPLRAIFEAMGAEVKWDNDTRTVTATRGDTTISLAIGSDQLVVNGEAVTIDVPAQIINDRTMIPVRAVAESFGCNVNWNQKAKRVAITEG